MASPPLEGTDFRIDENGEGGAVGVVNAIAERTKLGTTKNGARLAAARQYEVRCIDCKKVKHVDLDDKTLSEFYIRRNSGTNGKRGGNPYKPDSYCKLCKRARQAKWSKENPEKMRANRTAWRERNREKAKKIKRDSYARKVNRYKNCPFDDIGPLVPADPLVRWLVPFMKREEWQTGSYTNIGNSAKSRMGRRWQPKYSAKAIAQVAGLERDQVEHWMRKGTSSMKIGFNQADAILTFCNAWYLTTILYPLEQEDLSLPLAG